jgi:hypothetical protein
VWWTQANITCSQRPMTDNSNWSVLLQHCKSPPSKYRYFCVKCCSFLFLPL